MFSQRLLTRATLILALSSPLVLHAAPVDLTELGLTEAQIATLDAFRSEMDAQREADMAAIQAGELTREEARANAEAAIASFNEANPEIAAVMESARPEPGARPARPEGSEEMPRPERPEGSEGMPRPERPEGGARPPRPENGERPPRPF